MQAGQQQFVMDAWKAEAEGRQAQPTRAERTAARSQAQDEQLAKETEPTVLPMSPEQRLQEQAKAPAAR